MLSCIPHPREDPMQLKPGTRIKAQAYQWIFIPAEDESVDPSWDMKTPTYQNTNLSIQDGRSYGGGFSVNEYQYENGDLVSMVSRGEFRSLKSAKAKAEFIFDNRMTA